jgi:hypothetical protein
MQKKKQFLLIGVLLALLLGGVVLALLLFPKPPLPPWVLTSNVQDTRVTVNSTPVPLVGGSVNITPYLSTQHTNSVSVTAVVDPCLGGYNVSLEKQDYMPDWYPNWLKFFRHIERVDASRTINPMSVTCGEQPETVLQVNISADGHLVVE